MGILDEVKMDYWNMVEKGGRLQRNSCFEIYGFIINGLWTDGKEADFTCTLRLDLNDGASPLSLQSVRRHNL